MALTTTYSSGAVTAGAQTVALNAFTNPSTAGMSAKVLGRFATGEYVLITGNTGTTANVVRGYLGSRAVAHTAYEGFVYALVSDTAWPAAAADNVQVAPVTITNAQEVTLTGTTGTDAAVVTAPWPAFLNCSGASGAGINLPVPAVGAEYVLKNTSSGVLNVFCVGGSINGTTGTTAVTLTATGALGDIFWCATSGAWQTVPKST